MTEITRVLFQRSPCATLVVDRAGKVLEANKEAYKALALDEERLVGAPVLRVIVADDRERARELFVRVLEGQERSWTSRFRRGDGSTRVQRVRAVPVMVDGVVRQIVVYSQDLTESRSGRPETLQLQTLLENVPGQLVFLLDVKGNIRYSSGLSRTHFRDDVDLVGAPFRDVLDPDHENFPLAAEMLKAVGEREDWGGLLWHLRVDGTSFPVRTFASPYVDPRNGRTLGCLVSGREVTAEFDWRGRAESAERLAGIGSLVASIARELDEGLKTVDRGLSDLASGDPQAGPAIRRTVDRIHSFAASLREFADDVTLARRQISPLEPVQRAVEALAFRAREARVELTVDAPEDLPTFHADLAHVSRILELVLENAVQALAGAGGVVRITFQPGPDGAVIRLADNGPGVPDHELEAIFQPFFTNRPGHTGLGLAVARGLAAAHGGRMWAEPTDGSQGLTVALEIPYDAPDSRLRFRSVPLTLSRQRSVLVVDDEDPVRSALRRFLEKVGFDVREAWSGRSALAQLTAGHLPEAILTDLKMSDGSGYWFLEQLSRDYPDLLRRTVVITGDTDYQEMSRLTREKGCPVIRKPLEPPELLELLDEVAVPA